MIKSPQRTRPHGTREGNTNTYDPTNPDFERHWDGGRGRARPDRVRDASEERDGPRHNILRRLPSPRSDSVPGTLPRTRRRWRTDAAAVGLSGAPADPRQS